MRVNGKQVNSPEEVARIVQSAADQSKVSLRIWSDGSEENVEVELARASDELPAHYRAWLGVVLQPAAKDGIEVSRVFPDSPADQAGLRDGDVIASIDGSSVDSVEAFIEKVGERAPGEEVKLVVERGDESRDIAVRLGDIERAPYPWLTSAFRQPRQSWELSEQLGETLGGMGNGVVLNALQELREDLASLRSEVAQLSGDREDRREQSGQDRDQKDQQPGFFEQRREERRSNRRGAEEDVDGLETRNFEPRGGTDPAHQIEIEQPDADRRDRENSEQERGVSQVEAADNESAVLGQRGRSSSRYYRDQWGNQNGNWSSRGRWNWQDGYDRWWSPGGSRSYNYNYPNYNNYYYRYGGVPYYYGGRPYSYGPRFGIRIGPSWGSYWY
jgi:TolA-binding protein